MTTIIINTRSNESKKMVEFLKTTRYANVLEEKVPNDETIQAMHAVALGKVTSYLSAKYLMSSFKKASGV